LVFRITCMFLIFRARMGSRLGSIVRQISVSQVVTAAAVFT
jgi:hypothetical protein